jgi:hypothetical protein
MLSETDHNLIEQYLLGNLSDEEMYNFQLRVQTERDFAEEVKLMSGIIKGIRKAGREEFKLHLKELTGDIADAPKTFSLFKIVSIAASFIVIIGLGYFFWLKHDKTNVIAEALNKTAVPFTAVKIPVKTITTKRTGQILKLNDAVNLSLPGHAWMDEQGKPLVNVKLSYSDLEHPVDQFLAGIPTAIDSGDQIKMLMPETMLAISLPSQKNAYIHPDHPLHVIISTTDTIQKNRILKLDTLNKTWIASSTEIFINLGKYPSGINQPDLLVPRLENTKKERFKIVVSDEKFPELAIYRNYIFEIAAEERNFNPADDQQIWSSIVVEKNGKSKPYKVTFKNEQKTVSYLVNPVFSKEHYVQAMIIYQKKLKDYEKQNLSDEDLKKHELAKVIRNNGFAGQYFRVFEITTPGIYSSAKLTDISNKLKFTVGFKNVSGKDVKVAQLAIADFSKNTLQRINVGSKITIPMDNLNNKAILAITGDNEFAYLSGQEFRTIFGQKDLTAVPLHILNKTGDYNILKSLFNPVELSLIEVFLKNIKRNTI